MEWLLGDPDQLAAGAGERLGIIGWIVVAWLFLVVTSYVLSTLSALTLFVVSIGRARFLPEALLWWTQTLCGVLLIGVLLSIPFVFAFTMLNGAQAQSAAEQQNYYAHYDPYARSAEQPDLLAAAFESALQYGALVGALSVAVIVVLLIVGVFTKFWAMGTQKDLNEKASGFARHTNSEHFVLLLRPFTVDQQVSSQTDSAFRWGAGFRRISSFLLILISFVSPFKVKRYKDGNDPSLEAFVEKVVTSSTRFHPFDIEVSIAGAVRSVGPLIAVGAPRTLSCGAGRVEVDEEADWRGVVSNLAAKASIIVFLPGRGEGTYWEIANIAVEHAAKTIFVALPDVALAHVANADPLFPSLERDRVSFDPAAEWANAAQAARTAGLDLPGEYDIEGGAYCLIDGEWRRQGAFSVLFPGAVKRSCRRLLKQRLKR